MLRILIATFFMLQASAGIAAEVIGTVTGSLDGVDMTWYLTADDNTSQSDWSGGDNYPALTIFAHATNDNTWNTKGALIISFNVFVDQLPLEFQDGEVILIDTGMADSFVSSRDIEAPSFSITAMSVVDGKLSIKGTFAAKMYHSSDFGRNLDMENMKTVTGSFDATLNRLG